MLFVYYINSMLLIHLHTILFLFITFIFYFDYYYIFSLIYEYMNYTHLCMTVFIIILSYQIININHHDDERMYSTIYDLSICY
jgi:hypothetical protein